MANKVFANNMEVACKAAAGMTICALPDVCMTPPENPATPPGVPIPYPNTGKASDTTKGSKTVKISNKEVCLKNKSYFKTSYGDEAGCAAKKGVITSKNKGKVYFQAWSSDVKFEGENAVRHFDLTTNNHASFPGDTPPWAYLDSMSVADESGPCKNDIKKEKSACEKFKPHKADGPDACEQLKQNIPYTPDLLYQKSKKPGQGSTNPKPNQLADTTAADDCMRARRCMLHSYKKSKTMCCSPQTGHHLVESSALFETGRGGGGCVPLPEVNTQPAPPTQFRKYDEDEAPCVCAEGTSNVGGSHGAMHTLQSIAALKATEEMVMSSGKAEKVQSYKKAKQNGIEAMGQVFQSSFCDPACIEKQIDNYHEQCGVNNETKVKAVVCGATDEATVAQVRKEIEERFSSFLLSKLG